MIRLSDCTDFPGELVTRAAAAIAQRGGGKSYLAMLLTEQMHGAGAQIAALDPTGVWWGLRAAADGKKPGLPIIVMGGANGDVPLQATAGEIAARFVVESGRSVILDLSDFSIAEMQRFATAFAETLFLLKARAKSPLHLMIDEADTFAPQKPMPGQQRMLGAFEKLVKQGRSRGLGMTLISQRPAVLNKNVLSQVDVLLCGRVTGRHDHKALEDWTALFGTREESADFLASVPKLETGEFWIWSPSWLRTFRKIKVGRRWTFDSSKTPDVSDGPAPAPKLAPVDLTALSAEIAGSVERAKENDPRALREKIAALEKDLAARPAPEKEPVPVFDAANLAALDKLTAAVVAAGGKCMEILAPMRKELERIVGAKAPEILRILPNPHLAKFSGADAERALRELPDEAQRRRLLDGDWNVAPEHVGVLTGTRTTAPRPPAKPRPAPPRELNGTPRPLSGGEKLEKCDKALLTVLAQNAGRPVTKSKLAICSTYSAKSGSFRNTLGKLRRLELITGAGDSIEITPAGIEALGEYEPLPTGRAAVQYWAENLPDKCAREILATLLAHGPFSGPESLAAATPSRYSHSSGSFRNALGNLRTRELITRGGTNIALLIP